MHTRTAFIASLLLCSTSCGGKKGTEVSEPPAPPGGGDSSVPVATPTATPEPKRSLADPTKAYWVGFANSLIIEQHSDAGSLTSACNLAETEAFKGIQGGIMAITPVVRDQALVLIKPASGAEIIALVDTSAKACTAAAWYGPDPSFQDLGSGGMQLVPQKDRDYKRLFVVRSSGVERFTSTSATAVNRTEGPNNTPFIPAVPQGPGGCAANALTGMGAAGEGEGKVLILMSAGEGGSRINLVGNLTGGAIGNPICIASYNYAAPDQKFTVINDTPVGAVQVKNSVYVLYQNAATGGKIIRYNFNGKAIYQPATVSTDLFDVGYSPKSIASLSNSVLLVAAQGNRISVLSLDPQNLGKALPPWTAGLATSVISVLAESSQETR